MIETILFQNMELLWPVGLIALVLLVVFIWKEWSTPIRKRFFLHLLIACITIFSFALLALKPLKEVVKTTTGVLLTDGYSKKKLDSLKKGLKGIKVITYSKNLPITSFLDSLGTLYVLGDGVQTYDFWQFEKYQVRYLGADMPDGIVGLNYAKENSLGTVLNLTGRYHKAKPNHRLVLEDGNGQGLDSVLLDATDVQDFQLTTSLKATGRFVFELVEKDSMGKPILNEPLPFKVVPAKKFKILVINSFPAFETKYLKNYLSEMGHEIVVRSQLTRGRYKFEYLNTEKHPIYRLNEKELESFDLLLMDANSLRNLRKGVKTSLENTIKNNGLGLFIQAESSLFSLPFDRSKFQFERDGISKVILDEFPKTSFEKFPYTFKDVAGLEKIHSTTTKTFTGYKRVQKGRVGTTLLQNTYQLQLDGKTEEYKKFWTTIIAKLAKKEALIVDWEVTTVFPLLNHPFSFELRTARANPKVGTEQGNAIALRQDIDITSLWRGTTYPSKQGWNEVKLNNESATSLDFHVTDSLSWQSLRAHRTQKENRRHFANRGVALKKTISFTPIEPLWFFLIGLLGFAYLWLYPKVIQS